MRHHLEYLINRESFVDVDLYRNGGMFKIFFCNAQHYSYVTYGNSIVTTYTSIINRLEANKGLNLKLQEAYNKYGDANLFIEILCIENNMSVLRELSKDYIRNHHPSLNYLRNGLKEGGAKFTIQHRKSLSDKKIGELHNRAKLTEEDAITIKKLALYTNMTSVEIGRKFNISHQQVRKIKSGIAWSHLTV